MSKLYYGPILSCPKRTRPWGERLSRKPPAPMPIVAYPASWCGRPKWGRGLKATPPTRLEGREVTPGGIMAQRPMNGCHRWRTLPKRAS